MKGVFVELSSSVLGAMPNIIPFQFNPDNITRTLVPRDSEICFDAAMDNRCQDIISVPLLPSETITMSIQLDATDKLSDGNLIASLAGIQPAISAIELMMYPKKKTASLIPAFNSDSQNYTPLQELPLVLFILGVRIYPIKITSMTITEQAFDTTLNPIRAEIQVSVQVLNSDDKNVSDLVKSISNYTKRQKEVMAAMNLANLAGNVREDLPNISSILFGL